MRRKQTQKRAAHKVLMPARGYPKFFEKHKKARVILEEVATRIKIGSEKATREKPMFVLVTGMGSTGKTSLRRALVENLKKSRPDLEIKMLDMDRWRNTKKFREKGMLPGEYDIVHHRFKTQEVVPKKPVIYIIEDVQAITSHIERKRMSQKIPVMPLNFYDKIVYVGPKPVPAYMLSWIKRGRVWFKTGGSVGLKSGELVQRKYAPENIPTILKEIKLSVKERNPRFKRDLEVLESLKKERYGGEVILLTGKKELPLIRHLK